MGSEADTSDEEHEDSGSEHSNTESAEDDESTASENDGNGSFVFEPATRSQPEILKADGASGSVTGKPTNDTSCHQAERHARIGK